MVHNAKYQTRNHTETRVPITDPTATLHRDRGWRQRAGAKVPAPECLPPADRVSARDFAVWMEDMMNGEAVGS